MSRFCFCLKLRSNVIWLWSQPLSHSVCVIEAHLLLFQGRCGLRRLWTSLNSWHTVPPGGPCRPNSAVIPTLRSPPGPVLSSTTAGMDKWDFFFFLQRARAFRNTPKRVLRRLWTSVRSWYVWVMQSATRRCWTPVLKGATVALCSRCWWVPSTSWV